MPVKVSPISRGAALLIVAVGVMTYYYVDDIAGIVFMALGIALYWLLYRFTRRIQGELSEERTSKKSG